MRYTLKEAYIFTNMSKNSAPTIDTSHMNVVPDSDDEAEEPKPAELEEHAMVDPSLLTYDDGSGSNVVVD